MRRHALHIAAALFAFSAGLTAAGSGASLTYALPLFLVALVLFKLVIKFRYDCDILPVAALSILLWTAGVYAFVEVSGAFDRDYLSFEGENIEARASTPAPPIPEDTVITLERTGCFGPCPRYTVSIFADGSVVFYASPWRNFTKTSGAARGQISREQMRGLLAEFERVDYFSLKDSYETVGDGCASVATDNARAITSLQLGGRKKTVRHYYGCLSGGRNESVFPRKLTALESKIDAAAGSWRWIGQAEDFDGGY